MKALVAGILGLFALTANAGGIDCRSGVDHKHPACVLKGQYSQHIALSIAHENAHRAVYNRPAVVHVHHGHGHRHHWNHHRHAPVIVHRHHNDWVVPLVGGVILGAVINEAADRKNDNPAPTPQVNCTEWREVMQSDGTIARERTCYQK